MDEPLYTEWRWWSPPPAETKLGLKKMTVMFLAGIGFLAIPYVRGTVLWLLVPVICGTLFLLCCLDAVRLCRNRNVKTRWRFTDRGMEREWMTENCDSPFEDSVGFDTLSKVFLRRGTVGFYERYTEELQDVLDTTQFASRATLEAVLIRIAAHGVEIVHDDDTLATARYASIPADAG